MPNVVRINSILNSLTNTDHRGEEQLGNVNTSRVVKTFLCRLVEVGQKVQPVIK